MAGDLPSSQADFSQKSTTHKGGEGTFQQIFEEEYKHIYHQGLCFAICFRGVRHPEYPSVLQALEIEDPVVANCLIDQRAVECILLIKVGSLKNQVGLGF